MEKQKPKIVVNKCTEIENNKLADVVLYYGDFKISNIIIENTIYNDVIKLKVVFPKNVYIYNKDKYKTWIDAILFIYNN